MNLSFTKPGWHHHPEDIELLFDRLGLFDRVLPRTVLLFLTYPTSIAPRGGADDGLAACRMSILRNPSSIQLLISSVLLEQ